MVSKLFVIVSASGFIVMGGVQIIPILRHRAQDSNGMRIFGEFLPLKMKEAD